MTTTYVELTKKPNEEGHVDFIVNKTRGNFVNLGGINPETTINAVHHFMCCYHIWKETDTVISTRRHSGYKAQTSHDISFVLIFYDMIRRIQERKNQEHRLKLNTPMQPAQPTQPT